MKKKNLPSIFKFANHGSFQQVNSRVVHKKKNLREIRVRLHRCFFAKVTRLNSMRDPLLGTLSWDESFVNKFARKIERRIHPR